mmetsp:Transcript_35017/g.81246  ORF Transcript_35017/g.81246 Transcript_35017/m.81246 type:complete len:203 (+) Transcript_35017:703-1311(+)
MYSGWMPASMASLARASLRAYAISSCSRSDANSSWSPVVNFMKKSSAEQMCVRRATSSSSSAKPTWSRSCSIAQVDLPKPGGPRRMTISLKAPSSMDCDRAYFSMASLRLARASRLESTSFTSCTAGLLLHCRKGANTSLSMLTGSSDRRGSTFGFPSAAGGSSAGTKLSASASLALPLLVPGAAVSFPGFGRARNCATRSS